MEHILIPWRPLQLREKISHLLSAGKVHLKKLLPLCFFFFFFFFFSVRIFSFRWRTTGCYEDVYAYIFSLKLSFLSVVPDKKRSLKLLADVRGLYDTTILSLKHVAISHSSWFNKQSLTAHRVFLLGLIYIKLYFELMNKICNCFTVCSFPITNNQVIPPCNNWPLSILLSVLTVLGLQSTVVLYIETKQKASFAE